MFPKLIYESLPYIYLSLGLSGGLVITTTIVVVASILLIAAGILIITMRIRYRRWIRRSHYLYMP
jgi:hypothetical protein